MISYFLKWNKPSKKKHGPAEHRLPCQKLYGVPRDATRPFVLRVFRVPFSFDHDCCLFSTASMFSFGKSILYEGALHYYSYLHLSSCTLVFC